MIATITPLTRLPRHLARFDYLVPADLQDTLAIGTLVRIPFRSSFVFGIVTEVHTSRPKGKELKSIDAIVQAEPLVSKEYLSLFATVSDWYGISLSTILKTSLLPLQKRKLKIMYLTPLKKNKKKENRVKKPEVLVYRTKEEHRATLQKTIQGTTLLVFPERHLLEDVLRVLTPEQQQHAILWHSALTPKKQFELWLRVRNGEATIILGTRGAVFLPFPQLDTVIIDFEHDENHKHWDQTPRFHVKDIVGLLQKIHGASVYYASFSPSVESYYGVYKNLFRGDKKSFSSLSFSATYTELAEVPKILNMHYERGARNQSPLADEIRKVIEEGSGDIFIFVNRRGYALSLRCPDCGHTEVCPTCEQPLVYHEDKTLHCHYCKITMPAPVSCAKCGSVQLYSPGSGTQQLEKMVRELCSNSETNITRIDSDTGSFPPPLPGIRHIIIGTTMAFPYIKWEKTDCIVWVDIDHQLLIPDYAAFEQVWHRIHDIQWRRKEDSQFFIQTNFPHHLCFFSLKEADRFYRLDLNGRRSFDYPPYRYLVRYIYGHRQKHIAQKEATRLVDLLEAELTRSKKTAILQGPVEMHPQYFRKKFWYTIILKLPRETWQNDLLWLNTFVPETWKVDPRPLSVCFQ